jgi:hypothetical protein
MDGNVNEGGELGRQGGFPENGQLGSSGALADSAGLSSAPLWVGSLWFAATPSSFSPLPGGSPLSLSSSSGEFVRCFFPLVSVSVLSSLSFRFRELPWLATVWGGESGVGIAPPALGQLVRPADVSFKGGFEEMSHVMHMMNSRVVGL